MSRKERAWLHDEARCGGAASGGIRNLDHSIPEFSRGGAAEEQLWSHRNLGKAFYENPTTHAEAVEEFKKALDLAPDSAPERVNYGLALLRAGKTKEGIEELEKAQKQDPKIPHTWFSLGIAFKKEPDYDRAIQEFEQMVLLVPGEAVSYYNLGYLYKAGRKTGSRPEGFRNLRQTRSEPCWPALPAL